MSLEINKNHDGSLVAIYTPEYRVDDILEKIRAGGCLVKKIFCVAPSDLIEPTIDGEIQFVIGSLEGKFYRLSNNVFGLHHNFFIERDLNISKRFFIGERNVSILREIDRVVQRDIYITAEDEKEDGATLSYKEFVSLLKVFPTRTELYKYVQARMARVLENNLSGMGVVIDGYEKYLERKATRRIDSRLTDVLLPNKLKSFEDTYTILKNMLDKSEGVDETSWQEKISSIVGIIYPKYILVKRETVIGLDGFKSKKPDFIMVDADGFVDVLEIKKPEGYDIVVKGARNEYVASRALSSAVAQIENYVYTLSRNMKENEKNIQEYFSEDLPKDLKVTVASPRGMLLLGRSSSLSSQGKKDLELIKRQYRNIVDIMTYDDLMRRLENIIARLEIQLDKT